MNPDETLTEAVNFLHSEVLKCVSGEAFLIVNPLEILGETPAETLHNLNRIVQALAFSAHYEKLQGRKDIDQ